MSFVPEIPETEATGELKRVYAGYREKRGYIPNYAKAFSHRIEVFEAWRRLQNSIRSHIRFRTYELVTLAAASTLKCTYLMLAHGEVLRKEGFEPIQVATIVRDYKNAELSPVEVAMMEFTHKLVQHANEITREDIEKLRINGLSDTDIMDVVLVGAARCFFSKVLDALDVEPDDVYLELEEDLREALTVGREFPK
jgi:uncharacterized peroxidase-related enzyme